jgi:alpha-N-arabinofuranosidase
MKTQRFVVVMMAIALITALAQNGNAQQVTMQVDASKTGAPIAKDLYGFFSEFLSNMYEGGLWAEMLGDRKFYYPVDSSPTQTPANSRKFVGRWRPVGPDEDVVMDASDVYVGVHSAKILLDTAAPHGIQQAGLGLKTGRQYAGRVILAADPGAQISVSLIWGPSPGDRQTIAVQSVGSEYAKYPLSFTAGADTENATLEIVGTGTGSFHIGAASLMPADNVDGYRADMIKLYKEIGPTLVRWPGGNFTSAYDWRDGIGDPDKRPPRYDFAWKALESNDMGIDDYMKLVALLDLDPYICVNDGFGDAFSAAQELEYVNGAEDTPMGKLRAANGHAAPYGVKWWNVGNEMYGSWQLGHMSLADYSIKQNMFVQALRKVDSNIVVVASGADPAEMTSTGAGQSITGKPVTEFGDPLADWDGGLLANSTNYLNAIAEHLYPQAEQVFDAQQGKFVPVDDSLADKARRLPNRVKCVTDAWDEYQKRFPHVDMSKVPISLDEWTAGMLARPGLSWTAGDVFQALSGAEAMHEMFRHSDLFAVSAYTALSRLLAYNKTDVTVAPLGLMFEIYRQHYGTIPVIVTGKSPQPDVQGTVNVDKPKVPSGSDTYPLDVAAALTVDRKALTIAVVNPTESAQQLDVSVTGVALRGTGRLWQIAPSELTTLNEAGKPMAVNIAESSLTEAPGKLTIPPISIGIYELPVQ